MGGAVAAIEAGFMQDEIEQAAYEYAKSIDDGEQVIVGVNKFVDDDAASPRCSRSIPSSQRQQAERLPSVQGRARDHGAVDAALADVARRGARHAEPARTR